MDEAPQEVASETGEWIAWIEHDRQMVALCATGPEDVRARLRLKTHFTIRAIKSIGPHAHEHRQNGSCALHYTVADGPTRRRQMDAWAAAIAAGRQPQWC